MPDELLDRLRRFHDDAFPQYREQFQNLVDEGQHPTTLVHRVFGLAPGAHPADRRGAGRAVSGA